MHLTLHIDHSSLQTEDCQFLHPATSHHDLRRRYTIMDSSMFSMPHEPHTIKCVFWYQKAYNLAYQKAYNLIRKYLNTCMCHDISKANESDLTDLNVPKFFSITLADFTSLAAERGSRGTLCCCATESTKPTWGFDSHYEVSRSQTKFMQKHRISLWYLLCYVLVLSQ